MVSYDDGDSWHDLARSAPAGGLYSIGGSREVTRDGFIIGSYTDQTGIVGDVYFFKIRTLEPGYVESIVSSGNWDNEDTWAALYSDAPHLAHPTVYHNVVPTSYDGVFVRNGGSVSVGSNVACRGLYLGGQQISAGGTDTGELTLMSGTLTVGSDGLTVGAYANGTLNQSGGQIDSASNVILGSVSGATGTYTMTAGVLSGADFYVGYQGVGTLDFNGTVTAQSFRIGESAGSEGYVNMTGGSLAASGAFYVGSNGTGSLIQSGGSIDAMLTGTNVMVGYASGTTGYHEISGTGSFINHHAYSLGHLAGSYGHLKVTGGSFNAGPYGLYVGVYGTGSFELGGGVVDASQLCVAYGASGTGHVEMTGGQLNISGSLYATGTGSMAVSGGKHSVNTINLSNFSFTGGTLHAGTVNVDITNFGGRFAPYSPGVGVIGTSTVRDFSMTDDAVLEIELGGQGWFDKVVSQDFVLNGTLDVVLYGGYTPGLWDSYTIISASNGGSYSITGAFDVIPEGWSVSIEGTDLVLIYGIRHPGDTNLDGDVDAFDYLVLQAGYGTASGATWDIGDFDGDGDVDIFDYLDLQSNYGWTASGGGGSSIPEPATLSLLALASLAVLRRKR